MSCITKSDRTKMAAKAFDEAFDLVEKGDLLGAKITLRRLYGSAEAAQIDQIFDSICAYIKPQIVVPDAA